MFGWTWDEARGQRLSDLIVPPAFRDAHEDGPRSIISRPARARCSTGASKSAALHRDGHEFPIELSVTASEQFGGKLFIGFVRDISRPQAGGRAPAAHPPGKRASGEEHADRGAGDRAADRGQFARHGKLHRRAFPGGSKALARAHQLLVGQVWHDVAISSLVERVLGAEVAAGRARFGGPEMLLKAGPGARPVDDPPRALHQRDQIWRLVQRRGRDRPRLVDRRRHDRAGVARSTARRAKPPRRRAAASASG